MNFLNIRIKLNTVDQVKDFVDLTSKIPNIIDASRDRYIINAKSGIGLYSLDLTKPFTLTIYGDLDVSYKYELRKFEALE